jgi:hypothetical protein
MADPVAVMRAQQLTTRFPPLPDRSVKIYPLTWRPWLRDCEPAAEVLSTVGGDAARTEISRTNLVNYAKNAKSGDPDNLVRLFVATMMWGSGTTNGRGPRNTSLALRDPRLADTLGLTQELVLAGNPEGAYAAFRVDGLGPSFFTKWLWAVALGTKITPTPLILDERVWASLGALGWSSLEAAGSRRRALRYRAYLETMADWARADLPGITSPEDLEEVLFQWRGRDDDRDGN